MAFKRISKVVWLVSLVSLCNDFSSEMLYPIIPLYLQQTGFGTWAIGVLEGFAELIAGFSKIAFGKLSDHTNRRLPFIQLGYALSVFSRPLIGLSSYLGVIFLARSADRIGKGIRTGARDALLADEADPEHRAEIFGFHRSMDTLGAVLGPLAALLFLHQFPEQYRWLFFIAFIPGIISLFFTTRIKEKTTHEAKPNQATFKLPWKDYWNYYKLAPTSYKNWLIVLFFFALVNSSDMFLLLRAKQFGFSDSGILQLYIGFNLFYALFSYPIGRLTKSWNLLVVFRIGLLLYAGTYLFLSTSIPSKSPLFVWTAFALYGLFYGSTQGIVKTILVNLTSSKSKASAIGLYEGLNSIGLLCSNIMFGLLWYQWGAEIALALSGFIVLLICFLLTLRKSLFI